MVFGLEKSVREINIHGSQFRHHRVIFFLWIHQVFFSRQSIWIWQSIWKINQSYSLLFNIFMSKSFTLEKKVKLRLSTNWQQITGQLLPVDTRARFLFIFILNTKFNWALLNLIGCFGKSRPVVGLHVRQCQHVSCHCQVQSAEPSFRLSQVESCFLSSALYE